MTFEQLQTANEQIKTTDIKGKQYAEVNQRIKAFRMLFPNGSIETDITSIDGNVCIIKATVKDDFGTVIGIGHAYEEKDSSFINKTSYIENCETSAVGRALGMCGIGIDTSVASADEVLTAIKQQESIKPIGQEHINTLRLCIPKHGQTEENVCKFFGVNDLSGLNFKQFDILMKKMGEE